MDILDVLISLKNSYSSVVNPDMNVGYIERIYMEELENKLDI